MLSVTLNAVAWLRRRFIATIRGMSSSIMRRESRVASVTTPSRPHRATAVSSLQTLSSQVCLGGLPRWRQKCAVNVFYVSPEKAGVSTGAGYRRRFGASSRSGKCLVKLCDAKIRAPTSSISIHADDTADIRVRWRNFFCPQANFAKTREHRTET